MGTWKTRIDWPHVALVAIAAAFLLGALGLVLALTPPELLGRLVEADWPAIGTAAAGFALVVFAALRRAGILRDVVLEASDLGAAERRARDIAKRRSDPTTRVDRSGRASIVVLFAVAGAAIATAVALHGCSGPVLPAIAGAWAVAKPVTCAAARYYERLVCDVPESVDARDAGAP